jgi:hypothetical protein
MQNLKRNDTMNPSKEAMRQAAIQKLDEAGIRYDARNDGLHLIIRLIDNSFIDFWPTTGRWTPRGNKSNLKTETGINSLLLFIEFYEHEWGLHQAVYKGVVNIKREKPHEGDHQGLHQSWSSQLPRFPDFFAWLQQPHRAKFKGLLLGVLIGSIIPIIIIIFTC